MIRATSLSKTYRSREAPTTVLDAVSVDLRPGQLTSIIGSNGAGKSTLLSILSRLIDADHGTVLVDALDLATAPSVDIAQRLSVLRQDTSMTSRLTVRELVAFGRFPHSGGRLTPECERIVDDAIDFFELHEFRHRYLDQISGGQRQRAFVAMVLAQDTPYVLLDEPLNNLDMRHAARMMGHLRRLVDELGKAVVLVIHDVNFASAYSDRLIALREGVVLADGSPAEIMRPEVLERIYDFPIRVETIDGVPYAIYFRPPDAAVTAGVASQLTEGGLDESDLT